MYFFTLLCFAFSLLASQAPVQEQIETRWDAFEKNRTFIPFERGKTDEELTQEFIQIQKIRAALWEEADFVRAEHLTAHDLVRAAPECCAFDYNNTEPYYNASTIWIGGKRYIACEGPRSKDVPAFFNLLASHQVTHLVRLTGSYEGWIKKCHPYWDGLVTESEGQAYLTIPTERGDYSLQTFHMDSWRDHHGIDPEELLALVLKVRDGLNKENGLLCVHCSAGVGRTGTFLASLAIVDAIDQGEPFSIEEIVYRLSLQRAHSVAKFPQYITLHRLAEIYERGP